MSSRNLNAKLKSIMQEDSHNGTDGYLVRSLYFDTFSDDDFFDKEAGIENRRKIRLRLYPPNFDAVYLEIKGKNGAYQHKRSILMKKSDANALISGEHTVLLQYEDDLAVELYRIMSCELYSPRCIIQYKRSAFEYPVNNIRLTIDREIEANENNLDIFSERLSFYPIFNMDDVVFELKYNHFLFSYIKELLVTNDKMETSASKYWLSRQLIR